MKKQEPIRYKGLKTMTLLICSPLSALVIKMIIDFFSRGARLTVVDFMFGLVSVFLIGVSLTRMWMLLHEKVKFSKDISSIDNEELDKLIDTYELLIVEKEKQTGQSNLNKFLNRL
ncbi:hypothetical protein V425_01185 [Lactococcus lactis RTB018]|uniref:hypothetical protein n=1 Tax=Lactococcus garvieae TaxID=1363 RepID=UPI0007EE14DE|nr:MULTISPECIES: hypothetical protein [Lactococcus]NHI69345.1 hypothetical protein [Lactococcus garvieae]NHJ06500.1 hypothetical protein [Lactococcus garvieae]OAZ17672.1 hypothetical protein V425_01185 [Lactococcus lactis RTB018]